MAGLDSRVYCLPNEACQELNIMKSTRKEIEKARYNIHCSRFLSNGEEELHEESINYYNSYCIYIYCN